MKKKKPVEWTKLDNAAKIFPPNTNEKDTKVFRIACHLHDDIKPILLQESVDKAIALFPLFKSVLRKGLFWYYFEETEAQPVVIEEIKPPCSAIYVPNRNNHLFQVSYYKKTINLEIYHALTDGTGALWFLKTILLYYITEYYKEEFKDNIPQIDYVSTESQMKGDSFLKHYTGPVKKYRVSVPRAYKISGRRSLDNRINIIEGMLSVKETIDVAHKYNTSLTVYLTALFIYSIYMDMPERNRKHPVVLTIPVNLRNYFLSGSARNFFATINIEYDFRTGIHKLEDIIESVKNSFKKELDESKLKEHLNRLASLERNAIMRVIPLSIKDIALRIANSINAKGLTAAISNLGKITLPEELEKHVDSFSVYTSVRRPQLCICSYKDKLSVSFISPFNNSDIQKTFYRLLSEEGVEITIRTNE
ncbi:MAG TPA: hypothetical protein GXZ90_00780 [Clostridiales bacterium]|nr:hypothetical protein [Clostridiales bacterium]